MPARNPYVDFLVGHFAPLGVIVSRAMFGGHCLYCDGTVFAIVANNTLYLKANEESRHRFLARGLQPFKPFENRDGVMSYYAAPPEIFEDEDAMKQWVGGSIEAASRSSRDRPARKRKSRSR